MLVLDLAYLSEQVLEAAREQTFRHGVTPTLNSESLAGASLSVSENRAVVAHKALINNAPTDLHKDLDLGCFLPSDIIKCELLFVCNDLQALSIFG